MAGGEAVLLGVLVFVSGTLLMLSMWTLVDAKLAVEAAAREATRALVESPGAVLTGGTVDEVDARVLATDTAVSAMTAQRGAPGAGAASWSLVDVLVDGTYERCAEVVVTVRITVDTPRLPFVGRRLTAGTIEGSHVERVEPYRADVPVPDGGLPC